MRTNALDIRPLSGALGAEILGLDLSDDLDGDTVAAVRAAWLEHLVIFFREQTLSPARLVISSRTTFSRCSATCARRGMRPRASGIT